ncbi:SUR7/PalI family-domain-containing protein [Nemania diffusa]|nr:SUR7/PalI family-domain-containing protein [Nemania diffusa]
MGLSYLPRRQSDDSKIERGCDYSGRESADTQARQERRTTTRRIAIVVSWFCFLLALLLLILVEIGNTQANEALGGIYLLKLDIGAISARSVPSGVTLHNSIARSQGLYDFYQAGLWNYCEGYKATGITYCSKPDISFWFNPLQVLPDELVKGVSLGLPGLDLNNTLLDILRVLYRVMVDLFLSGTVLNALLLVSSPIVLYSRWWNILVMILCLLTTLVVIAAAGLSTAISYLFQTIMRTQTAIGVSASVGTWMLGLQWTAAVLTSIACIIHFWASWGYRPRREV